MSDGLTGTEWKGQRWEARKSDPNNAGMWALRVVGDRFWDLKFIPPAIEAAIRAPIEARAEAAEARVAELERALIWMSGSAEFGPGQPAHDRWVEIRDTLLFAPTTEAVRE